MSAPTPTHEPDFRRNETQFWDKPDEETWYPEPRTGPSEPDGDVSVQSVPGLATDPADVSTALGRYLATLDRPERPPTMWEQMSPAVRGGATAAIVVVIALAVVVITGRGGSHATAPRRVAPVAAYLADARAGVSGSLVKQARDADLVALGRGICAKLDLGPPAALERDMLTTARGMDFSPYDAVGVTRAASAHLCPAHAAAVRAWVGH